MARHAAIAGFVAMVLLAAPGARAAVIPEPGLDYFERGIARYRNGDYASALYLFNLARAAGNRNPNLRYDIGLTLFQLERYDDARAAFENLYFEPGYEAIADYHLGLIAARTGDREAAATSLRRAAQGEQEPLRQLAGAALAGLDGLSPRNERAAYLALGGGYDSNAGYQSDDLQDLSDTADSFAEGIGVVEYPIDRRRALVGSMYAREYTEAGDYSQQTAQVGMRDQFRWGDWLAQFEGRTEGAWVGGDTLHTAAALGLEGRHVAGPGLLVLRVATTRIGAGDEFAELGGWRHGAGIDFATGRTTFGYDFELNDRKDLAQDGEFASRSPTRHQLAARSSRPVAAGVTIEWRARYRHGRYGDADRFDGTVERRRDVLSEAAVGGRFRLSQAWSLLAEARLSRNTSSLDHYEYRRASGLLSLEATL